MATKGEATRERVLTEAARQASLDGIEALSIGGLASALEMSKSGLFARFGSKEAIQLGVLNHVADRFRREVAEPALAGEPGRVQLVRLLDLWIAWSQDPDRPGGCQLIAAAFDVDAHEGAVRDRLADLMRLWLEAIRSVANAARVAEPDLALNEDEAASLLLGLYMSQHVERFLLNDDRAARRVLLTLERHLNATSES